MPNRIEIRPHRGPQEDFLATPADIALFGGAAGSGKSTALLLEAARNVGVRGYRAGLFRRTAPELRGEGGLWDESQSLYRLFRGQPLEHTMRWRFPAGSTISMVSVQYDKDLMAQQGRQYAYEGLDELTTFTSKQFWFLQSRLRTSTKVRPYTRATCNPSRSSWVKSELIRWYLDEEGSFPDPAKAGVLRWFVRIEDVMHWADSPEELKELFPKSYPQSFTFIPAKLEDNPTLERNDPSYRAKLEALPRNERDELLLGSWNSELGAGDYFDSLDFEIVDAPPFKVKARCRAWDRAASEPSSRYPDPDWTTGVLQSLADDGTIFIEDRIAMRRNAGVVERTIVNQASQDPSGTVVVIFKDPGAAGKGEAEHMVRVLAGHTIHVEPASSSKTTMAKPLSAQARHGNVKLVRGDWNQEYLANLQGFPLATHDDDVDASSLGFIYLTLRRRPDFAFA